MYLRVVPHSRRRCLGLLEGKTVGAPVADHVLLDGRVRLGWLPVEPDDVLGDEARRYRCARMGLVVVRHLVHHALRHPAVRLHHQQRDVHQ